MHSEVTLVISGAMGVVARLLVQAGVAGRWVSILTAFVSLGAVLLYGFDAGDIKRETSWDYFLVWVEVNGVTAGVYHGIKETQKKLQEGKDGGL